MVLWILYYRAIRWEFWCLSTSGCARAVETLFPVIARGARPGVERRAVGRCLRREDEWVGLWTDTALVPRTYDGPARGVSSQFVVVKSNIFSRDCLRVLLFFCNNYTSRPLPATSSN